MNCPVCGKELPPQSAGRPRKYCSDRCKLRAARHRADTRPTARAADTKPRAAISNGELDDIVNGPVPGYEDSLRLVVRRLTAVMESPDTSPRDLAAVGRQLIDAARLLDNVRNARAALSDILTETDIPTDIGNDIV